MRNINNEIINNLLDGMKVSIENNIQNIIIAIFILIIGLVVSLFIKKTTKNFLQKLNIEQPILGYTSYTIYIICLLLTTIITLSILKVPQASILSFIGVIGVSLGLAFKESISNIGSGYIILFLKPFKIGDYIEFSGVSGTVVSICIFNTTLQTFDNKTVIVPNYKLINENITNYTRQEKRRVDIKFQLPYGTDIDFAKSLIQEVLDSEKSILKGEQSLIGIRNFNENGMEIVIRIWANTEDYWSTFYSLMSKIEKIFRENNIDMSIPKTIIKK